MAESYARGQAEKRRTALADARANKLKLDWPGYMPPKPTFLGTRSFNGYDLAELARYIDWTPFFHAWELKGTFPRILDDDKYGEAARALYDDAQAILKQRIAEKWLTANAVVGFWPANAVGDDIELYSDDTRSKRLATLHTIRQQMAREPGKPNLALADFVAPSAPATGGPRRCCRRAAHRRAPPRPPGGSRAPRNMCRCAVRQSRRAAARRRGPGQGA
jgi:5-methyltetrahydrofolate--homocysteine methyltransferase